MRVIEYRLLVKNDPYFAGYTRVSFALIATAFLINASSATPFLELLFLKRFYFSMVFGFVLAIIIIEAVHWTNLLLDKICDWQVHRNKRLVLQLLFGVIAILYLDVWLVKGVYYLLGHDFYKGNFMQKIFPINVILVLFLHVLFFFRKYDSTLFSFRRWYQLLFGEKAEAHLFVADEIEPIKPSETFYLLQPTMGKQQLPAANLPHLLTAPFIKETEYWSVIKGYIQSTRYTFGIDEVLYIKTGAVYGDIYLKSGRVCNMHYRGKTLRENLHPNHFVEVQSGVFYALDVIEGKSSIGKNQFVVVKPLYKHLVVHDAISRRYLANFDEVFKAYKRRSTSINIA